MKTKTLIVIVLLLALVLIGCQYATSETAAKNRAVQLDVVAEAGYSVYRFVDAEYGNVCYVYRGVSISCVPRGE